MSRESEARAQRRVLKAAGWESVARDGEVVWRKAGSLFLYPQYVALRRVREEDGDR